MQYGCHSAQNEREKNLVLRIRYVATFFSVIKIENWKCYKTLRFATDARQNKLECLPIVSQKTVQLSVGQKSYTAQQWGSITH
jgi:hypothetical protein